MGIQLTTPMSEIDAYIKQQLERQERAIIYNFHYVGTQCINIARDLRTYEDQTGNLRSSIGYIIVKDGVIIEESSFEQVKDGSSGVIAGRAFVESLAAKYPHGIVLIVVAGMNYAAAVEAKSIDVLTSAELLAESLLPEMMKRLGFK